MRKLSATAVRLSECFIQLDWKLPSRAERMMLADAISAHVGQRGVVYVLEKIKNPRQWAPQLVEHHTGKHKVIQVSLSWLRENYKRLLVTAALTLI